MPDQEPPRSIRLLDETPQPKLTPIERGILASPQIYAVLDPRNPGMIVFHNPAFETNLGFTYLPEKFNPHEELPLGFLNVDVKEGIRSLISEMEQDQVDSRRDLELPYLNPNTGEDNYLRLAVTKYEQDGQTFYLLNGTNITDQKEVEKLKEYERTHDPLTHFLNKEGLKKLEDQINFPRRGDPATKVTFAFIDMDGLKVINDKLGHQAGDNYIERFSELLLQYFHRNEDNLIRINGTNSDEFGILITSEQLNSLSDHLSKMRTEHPDMPFSFGIATAVRGNNGSFDIADLVEQADQKMYQDKRKRKEK